MIASLSFFTSHVPSVPSPLPLPAATSASRRSVGKGASTMKKSWSVLRGPDFSRRVVRRVGEGEPRVRRERRTVGMAMGATSMGIVGQVVRRRDWFLR